MSLHAKEQLRLRRMLFGEVVGCIRSGRRTPYGTKVQADHRGIRVVFVPKPCHNYVITAARR